MIKNGALALLVLISLMRGMLAGVSIDVTDSNLMHAVAVLFVAVSYIRTMFVPAVNNSFYLCRLPIAFGYSSIIMLFASFCQTMYGVLNHILYEELVEQQKVVFVIIALGLFGVWYLATDAVYYYLKYKDAFKCGPMHKTVTVTKVLPSHNIGICGGLVCVGDNETPIETTHYAASMLQAQKTYLFELSSDGKLLLDYRPV